VAAPAHLLAKNTATRTLLDKMGEGSTPLKAPLLRVVVAFRGGARKALLPHLQLLRAGSTRSPSNPSTPDNALTRLLPVLTAHQVTRANSVAQQAKLRNAPGTGAPEHPQRRHTRPPHSTPGALKRGVYAVNPISVHSKADRLRRPLLQQPPLRAMRAMPQPSCPTRGFCLTVLTMNTVHQCIVAYPCMKQHLHARSRPQQRNTPRPRVLQRLGGVNRQQQAPMQRLPRVQLRTTMSCCSQRR